MSQNKSYEVSMLHVWLGLNPARQRIEFKLTVKTIEYCVHSTIVLFDHVVTFTPSGYKWIYNAEIKLVQELI